MNLKSLAESSSAGKASLAGALKAHGPRRVPDECRSAARSGPPPSALDRLAQLADGGAVLMMTTQFGRSPVRDTAYRLRERRPDLDLRLSWRLFTSLDDWGNRWPAEKDAFAAGLILSAAGDPVAERAVGRCLFDLARLGRPLLWGVVGLPLRWHPRFVTKPNKWLPTGWVPYPYIYARLSVAHAAAEFYPRFDPILFTPDPDFLVLKSRLYWREELKLVGLP